MNKKSWSFAGPYTWLVEPKRLPSKLIHQRASLGRLARQDGFPGYGTKLRKTSELRSHLHSRGGGNGVKGQDERQKTAPLTPFPPPQELFAPKANKKHLDYADDVIQGAKESA